MVVKKSWLFDPNLTTMFQMIVEYKLNNYNHNKTQKNTLSSIMHSQPTKRERKKNSRAELQQYFSHIFDCREFKKI